ncbi:protein of unknown function [Azospirillum lipoferum 4B]|uniref:Uncharacterized protein n=1 Tax=Azospirillum lipoferum (strain 4B) TaxID=862719 RepID=G7Z9G0_AZOL4|nr:protein of unknown function [Azospirillum lipoferum 4B]
MRGLCRRPARLWDKIGGPGDRLPDFRFESGTVPLPVSLPFTGKVPR